MKVALDITPITPNSGHKVRGSGFYLQNLVNEFKVLDPESFIFFSHGDRIPDAVDLIHIPYFDPFFISLPFFGINKTVVTIHDLIPFVFPQHFPPGVNGSFRWMIQKMLLSKTRGVITDSICSKKDILKFTNYPKNKISVIYLAPAKHFKRIKISLEEKSQLQKKYSLPDSFVLYVGDATWNKNIPQFITAMKEIRFPVVMVGKALSGEISNTKNIWNNDLNIALQMIFKSSQFIRLGFIPDEDLVKIYNLATAFVMPSRYEGFGLPVVEAMSCGIPVISTSGGSLKEIIGDAALIIDPENPKEMGKKINHVVLNKNVQKTLSEKSLRQAKKFSWENTARLTIEFYKAVISNQI